MLNADCPAKRFNINGSGKITLMVMPEEGCGWWPVMPVVLLSRMITV